MALATDTAVGPMDVRTLHERMGRVGPQPVRVYSFTNKRFTVNFRVPLPELRRVVPDAIVLDEVGQTGCGLLSMCACDFWVNRLGLLPIPPVRNNDMLCRISARVHVDGREYRAYYTLRSDSSSRLLGFFGRRFSHFRKRTSPFERQDDGARYHLCCRAADPLGRGELRAGLTSVTKRRPGTTAFADIEEATRFVFNLDGSCGYSYERGQVSFQKIDYPPWDLYFCHEYAYDFPLIDYLCRTFDLHATLDCVLFMEKTRQVWGTSRLYPSEA